MDAKSCKPEDVDEHQLLPDAGVELTAGPPELNQNPLTARASELVVEEDAAVVAAPDGECSSQPPSISAAAKRTAGIDGRMATIWAFCVLFIIDLFVVDNLTDTRDVLVWPVLLYSCLLFVMLVCFSMYIRKHMVTARLPAVTRSMLAWQVLLLNGVYFIISIAYPAPGEEWSVLFIHITIFCMLSAPVVLDACNTSPAEHKVSLIVLAVGVLAGLVGCSYLYADVVLYEGVSYAVDSSNRTIYTGRVTKNGVRINCLWAEMVLVLSTLCTVLLYDRDHDRYFFLQVNRKNPVTEDRQYYCDRRNEKISNLMAAGWVVAVVWVLQVFVVERFVDSTDAAVWPVLLHTALAVALLYCGVQYVRLYCVWERVRIVSTSLLAWQVVVLNAAHAVLTIAMPEEGLEVQVVPSNLFVFMGLSFSVVLDACNTTVTEHKVGMGILAFCVLMALIGNAFLFDNAVLFEGASFQVESHNRTVYTGLYTKNDVRINLMWTELVLVLSSLFTAFFYDSHHESMYFVKVSVRLPKAE